MAVACLEDRTLLAPMAQVALAGASLSAVPMNPAIADKLGPEMAQLYANFLGGAGGGMPPADGQLVGPRRVAASPPGAGTLQFIGDRLAIRAVAEGDDAEGFRRDLIALGATVSASYGRAFSAQVPVARLGDLAGLPGLRFARPSLRPTFLAGSVDNQAVVALKSDLASARFGVDGSGVTIGVLSDSFNFLGGYADDVASGDLPAGVNVLGDLSPGSGVAGTDEGRAMLQLIHDVAPGSPLAFHTAYFDDLDFAQGIRDLAKPVSQGGAGAKVIVDDVGYEDEPIFQDGAVAQAINDVVAQGVSYFSSAGNSGRLAYQAPFRPSSISTTLGLPGVAHNFNPNPSGPQSIFQGVTIPSGGQFFVTFQWDQPYASFSTGNPGRLGSQNNLDFYLVDSTKTQVVASGITNNVGNDPYETFAYVNGSETASQFYVLIKSASGSYPATMKYIVLGGVGSVTIDDYPTNTGTEFGHNMALGAAGVGAAFYGETPAYTISPAIPEAFSSAGGTGFLFDTAGNRLPAPQVRQTPRFVAPDGVETSFFGGQDPEFNFVQNFFGTSAAAPNAAAIAALMKQAVPSLTPAQIYSAMQATAADMGAAGFDFDTGFGLIQADRALAYVTNIAISGRAYSDANANGILDAGESGVSGVTVFLDPNGNNLADSGTTASLASSDVPKAIPAGTFDENTFTTLPSRASSALAVSGQTGRITKVTVTINVTAPNVPGLALYLISPKGIRIQLAANVGDLFNPPSNFSNTTFDDAAPIGISDADGSGSYAGTYQPQSLLASLVGEDPNGTWRLEGRDYDGANGNTINSWSLRISYADPRVTTDAAGNYAFNGLAPSSTYGTYKVREVVPNGFTQTSPAAPYNLTLGVGAQSIGNNFGLGGTVGSGPIVDNDGGAPGYLEAGPGWATSGVAGYGGTTRYHAAGTASQTATWTASGLTPGSYDVQVTWGAAANRATNAPYRIYDGATLIATVRVDQTRAPSGPVLGGQPFQSLGTFAIAGSSLRVVLGSDANNLVSADAVRALARAASVVDNDGGAPGYLEAGPGWATSGVAGYGGTTRYHAAGTASQTATWTASGLRRS